MKTFKSLKAALLMTAATLGATGVACVADRPAYAQEVRRAYNIRAQDLNGALREYAMQTGRDVLYSPVIVEGRQSPGVRGRLTEEQALRALLAGTGLSYERTASNGYAVRVASATSQSNSAGTAEFPEYVATLPEVLVDGSLSLNADLRRSEDDAQPYVVFNSDDIARSGAMNLEEFLSTRLPMNTQRDTSLQGTPIGIGSEQGRINLRGLGVNQTTILIDGRRVASAVTGFSLGQPNINGIPPAMIERIEILPSTAGALYGGNATGGVINVILKRNYQGLDLGVGYANTFDSDARRRDLSLSGGLTLNDGRTRITASASHADQNELISSDRDFHRQSIEYQLSQGVLSPDFFPGGTTGNIVSTSGANLTLDNGTPLNSYFTFVPQGYTGFAGDNSAGLVQNAGMLNLSMPYNSLYNAPTVNAAMIEIKQEFASWLDGFLSVNYDESSRLTSKLAPVTRTLLADSADNPFQQNIRVLTTIPSLLSVAEGEVESLRVNSGLIARFQNGWSGSIEYNFSRSGAEFFSSAPGPFVPGGAALIGSLVLRDLNVFPVAASDLFFPRIRRSTPAVATLQDFVLRFSGPIAQTSAGTVTLTGMIERREQSAGEFVFSNTANNVSSFSWTPEAFQDVTSYYLEGQIPIVSEQNGVSVIRGLDLSLAVRRDEYSTRYSGASIPVPGLEGPFPSAGYARNDVGSTDYTVSIRYRPTTSLAFRASYATGFLPADLGLVRGAPPIDTPAFQFSGLRDPMRGDTGLTGDASTGLITRAAGGNPDLKPELSNSFSVGFIFQPTFVPGLRLSMDYVAIEKTDEIITPNAQFIVDNEDLYTGRIGRGASLAGDAPGWAGPITFIDLSALNVASATVQAIDLQLDYTVESERLGEWRFYLIATRQNELSRQELPSLPEHNSVGFSDGPLEWRGNFGIDWQGGDWTAGWNAQYFDEYAIWVSTADPASYPGAVALAGSPTFGRQIYHDAYISYEFDGQGVFANSDVSVGIQNLFDETPPVRGFFGTSPYGDPRLRRFTFTLRKHF